MSDPEHTRPAPTEPASELATDAAVSASGPQTMARAGRPVDDGAAPPRLGTPIGRYVVLEEVGRGAMGVVYAAYDPKLDRRVALKLLKDRKGGHEMLREAQALARLNHPNVMQVYDAGEHDGRVFMTTELVVGRSLHEWSAQSPRSVAEVLSMFIPAAHGLAAAHEAELVHRDFKPDNVMVADDGRVLVMDFGLAVPHQVLSGESSDRVWASGTPAYMSPEQFSQAPVDARSDQFSYCVALFEAIAGERPFSGDTIPILASNVTGGRPAAATLSKAPRWLRTVVLQGLATDPADRHPSMHAVATALERGAARRRRQGATASAAVVVLGLGSVGYWSATRVDPAFVQCRHDADHLTAVWHPAWRGPARDAFVRGLQPDGDALWPRVDADVAAFVAGWGQAYADACTARFTARSVDETAHARETSCLQSQAEYATSLLDALDASTPAELREIAAVTPSLPAPAACDPADAPDVDEAADRDRIDEARRAIARASGRKDAGDEDAALAILTKALAGLQGVQAPATRAELLVELGRIAYRTGDLVRGERWLADAVVAATVSHSPRLTARAWIERVGAMIAYQDDVERAGPLLEVVDAAVAAAPSDPQLVADARSVHGLHANERGRYAQARDAFAAALEALDEASPGSTIMALHHSRLAASLAALGELAQARPHFERAAQLQAAAYGAKHPALCSSYGNLALLSRQEGDDDKARAWLDKALASVDADDPTRARAVLTLGQLEYDHGNHERAEVLAREAIAVGLKSYDRLHPSLTAPRRLLFNVLSRRKDVDGAFAEATAIVEIAEASTVAGHPKRALAHATLGDALRARGDLDEALDEHRLALQLRRDNLDAGDPRIGYSLVQTADCLLALRRPDEARPLAHEAIELFDRAPGVDDWRAEARFILAQSLQPEGTRAVELAQEAKTLYETLGPGHADDLREVNAWLAAATGRAPTQP